MKKTIVLLLFLLAVNAQNFQETSSLSRQKRNAASEWKICVACYPATQMMLRIVGTK